MSLPLKIACLLAILTILRSVTFSQDGVSKAGGVELDEDAVESSEAAEIDEGTATFDAEAVKELYAIYKKANEERKLEELPEHLNPKEMEEVELKPFLVRDSDIELPEGLEARLDPERMRQRLESIRAVNPKAYYDFVVDQKFDYEFWSGEFDPGLDSNAGRTANLSGEQLVRTIDAVARAVENLFRLRPSTDPTGGR